MADPNIGLSGEVVTLSPEQTAARKRRNLWIALSLAAFIVLVFLITMTRLQAGAS